MEIDTDTHYGVGPLGTPDGHDILQVSKAFDHEVPADDTLFVCLTCGLVSDDQRRFDVTDCERANNPIPKTLGEDQDGD